MPRAALSPLLLCLLLAACGGGGGDGVVINLGGTGSSSSGSSSSGGNSGPGPSIAGCPVFPVSAVFNTRIDDSTRFPAHASNTTWINSIGSTRALHADWGTSEDQQAWQTYYGIPYNVVDGTAATTDWPSVSFTITDPRAGNGNGVPDESDCAIAQGSAHSLQRDCTRFSPAQRRFPFPLDSRLKAEAGTCNDAQQCGDRHIIVLESGACRLWESYFSYKVDGQWYAYSTAAWDLNSHALRPDSWTSGDAAGLPILPLLARVDEASAGEIRHAFRVTFRDSVLARSYVWPARHRAGGDTPGGIPFGALLRLRSDFVIPSNWTTQARALATAMQRYGLYVSDIGSDLYVQGEPSAQWSSSTISQIQSLRMNQFEFVDTSSITGHASFSAGSMQASW